MVPAFSGNAPVGRSLRDDLSRGQEKEFLEGKMAIRKELLDILACPQCKGPLETPAEENGLICEKCRLFYEIKDDIPIMLIEKAKPFPE